MAPGGGLDDELTKRGSALTSCPVTQVEVSANVVVDGVDRLGTGQQASSSCEINNSSNEDSHVQVTCFTEVLDDATLYFQIICLHKQAPLNSWCLCVDLCMDWMQLCQIWTLICSCIYPTCIITILLFDGHSQNNVVSVANILGGASDNTGSGIARRIVLKTGLNVILACNIPKNSPMLEADAEKKLVQMLINLGYTRPKSNRSS